MSGLVRNKVLDKTGLKEEDEFLGEFIVRDPEILRIMARIARTVNDKGILNLGGHVIIRSFKRINGKIKHITIERKNLVFIPFYKFDRDLEIDLRDLETVLGKYRSERFVEVDEYRNKLVFNGESEVEVRGFDNWWIEEPYSDVFSRSYITGKANVAGIPRNDLEEILKEIIDQSGGKKMISFVVDPNAEKGERFRIKTDEEIQINLPHMAVVPVIGRSLNAPVESLKVDPEEIYRFLRSLPEEITEIRMRLSESGIEIYAKDPERRIDIRYGIVSENVLRGKL
ncbi:MAG: hypothetical protein QXN08_08870 [Nitrososphaerales archaeon]